MGFLSDPQNGGRGGGGGQGLSGFQTLIRRKQVDSIHSKPSHGGHQLAKELSISHLIAIGKSHCFLLLCVIYIYTNFFSGFPLLLELVQFQGVSVHGLAEDIYFCFVT